MYMHACGCAQREGPGDYKTYICAMLQMSSHYSQFLFFYIVYICFYMVASVIKTAFFASSAKGFSPHSNNVIIIKKKKKQQTKKNVFTYIKI